jgi:hypothetical protein
MPGFRRLSPFLLLVLLILFSVVPASAQQAADYPIPGGRFYTQTGGGQGGFSVIDDGQARFWSEFQRLGGLQTVGYPISRRFTYDGFTTQAFQKLVLQWRPEVGQAWPVNVFDELSNRGFNQRLYETRQTPFPLENFDPPGATWQQIHSARLRLLADNPAIRTRYLSVPDPLTVFGLPVSRVEDMGNHYAIRTQRAVFQQWKEAVPWAAAGQVTIANGGDIAKELGWLSGPAIQPEPGPSAPAPTGMWEVKTLLIGPGQPGLLWALQTNQSFPDPNPYARLLLSNDQGASWQPFGGGLPMTNNCLVDVSLDYATPNGLYASTCVGIYRWDGGQWRLISSQAARGLVVAYGNANLLWAIRFNDGAVIRSDDGGATWREISQGLVSFAGLATLAVDPRDNRTLYGVIVPRYAGSYLRRGSAEGGWQTMPTPMNDAVINTGLTIDGGSGDLYVSTLSDSILWRSRNPTTPDFGALNWEQVFQFDPNMTVNILASGATPQGLALYVTLEPKSGTNVTSTVYRSTDSGRSWSPLDIPRN